MKRFRRAFVFDIATFTTLISLLSGIATILGCEAAKIGGAP